MVQIPVTVEGAELDVDSLGLLTEELGDSLISRGQVEDEIDLMLRQVRVFWNMEPDMALRMIGAMSARCTELCVHLHRIEPPPRGGSADQKRKWGQIRTMQVEKLLQELDRQFKTHSRLIEVRRQDIALER